MKHKNKFKKNFIIALLTYHKILIFLVKINKSKNVNKSKNTKELNTKKQHVKISHSRWSFGFSGK